MSGVWVGKREAADRLGVSVKTVERRIKSGKLTREIVHGPHGPEIRVWLPATPAVVDATANGEPATIDRPATRPILSIVERFPPRTVPPDNAPLILLALEELAYENKRLRAMLESRRKPWWRRLWGKK